MYSNIENTTSKAPSTPVFKDCIAQTLASDIKGSTRTPTPLNCETLLTVVHDSTSAPDLYCNTPNPNHPPETFAHAIDYKTNQAYLQRKLPFAPLSYYEGEALRKIPVYERLGRYTPYSPYFPFFQERMVGNFLSIINKWATTGTLLRMLKNPQFKKLVSNEFFKNKTVVISRNHNTEAKITSYRCDRTLPQHIMRSCPALFYWLKDKKQPPPPVLLQYTEEESWLSESTYEIDGHGMSGIVDHMKSVTPFVITSVAYHWNGKSTGLVTGIVSGIGVYSAMTIARSLWPLNKEDITKHIPKAIGIGVGSGAMQPFSSVLLPIAEFYKTVDKHCCDLIPFWAKLPEFLRNILISFVGACALYAMFKTGNAIAAYIAHLVGTWVDKPRKNEIDGHAITPIICACALFSTVATNYDAARSMNMFRSLYSTSKVLESDFSVETSLKKWTNSICTWVGLDNIFETADLTVEWDSAYADYLAIETIENLDVAMVTDHTLPQRTREISKRLNELERIMRSCRQVPANYKSTASVVCLRANRLLKEIVRKNSRYSDRTEPLWLDFRGPPGQGKTVSADAIIATVFYMLFQRAIGPADRCSKAPSSQYWNGYHESVWVVVLQELCTCAIPDKNIPDISFLLSAIGKDYCPLDMADVESKGTMGFCSPLIVSTGNGDYSSAPIQEKSAIRRRVSFPLEVVKEKSIPLNPTLADFDAAWSFKASDEWLKFPTEYVGVWKDLISDVELKDRRWRFSQIVAYVLDALNAHKQEVSYSSYASALADAMQSPARVVLPNVSHINGEATGDYGEVYTLNGACIVDTGYNIIHVGSDDVETCYAYGEEMCPKLLTEAAWHKHPAVHSQIAGYLAAIGRGDRFNVLSELYPADDDDGFYFTVTPTMLGHECVEKFTATCESVSVKNMWGNYVTKTWQDQFDLSDVSYVKSRTCNDPSKGFAVYMLDEDGGTYMPYVIDHTEVRRITDLGAYFYMVPDEKVPYVSHKVMGDMCSVINLAGPALRFEDETVAGYVTDITLSALETFKSWIREFNVETLIAIAVGVPIAISTVVALTTLLSGPKQIMGQSPDKAERYDPRDNDTHDEAFLSKKGRRHIKVVSPWDSHHQPQKKTRHYEGDDIDWYGDDDSGAIYGHSGNDPTGFVRNLRKISVAGTNSVCWGLLIDASTMISVRHVFYNGGALSVFTTSGVQRSTTYTPSQYTVVASEGNDLVLIRFKTPLVGVRSIMKRIVPELHIPKYTRRIKPIQTNGVISSVITREASVIMVDGSFVIRQVPVNEQYPITYYAQVNDPGSAVGDCGLPYVDSIGGSDQIIGMHFGGNHGIACMTLISQDMLKYLISHAPVMEITAHASPLGKHMNYDVIPIVPGADVAGILDPEKCPVASSPPNRMHYTELQTVTDVLPPSMTLESAPATLRGPIALKATDYMKRGSARIDPLMEVLLQDDSWLLGSINWDEFHRTPLDDPLSLTPREVLLGRPGYLDGMNDKTSVGPLFKRGIYTLEGKRVQDKRQLWCLETQYVNPAFLRICVNRVNNTRRGIFTPTVVEARYKQELRDITAKGVTLGFCNNKEVFRGGYNEPVPVSCDSSTRGLIPREFYVSCPVDNYETRALMWSYMKRKHSLTTCNTCQVGINPYSIDWKILDDRTNKFPNMIILDVKSCDKTVMRIMAPAMERLFVHAYKAYDDPKMRTWIKAQVAKMFSYEVITPVSVDGSVSEAVLTFNETVASGLWVTTEMDGNWVYFLFRIAFEYMQVLREEKLKFDEHVVLVTYGDDNVGCVSNEVSSWFTRESIARMCYQHFGVVLTSLRKIPVLQEDPILPFDKREDKEFLKRKFFNDRRNVAILAPLEVSSIWNSLIWTGHKNMCPEDAVPYYGQILRGALNEISLHGKHAWDNFIQYFKPKYRKLGGQWPPHWTFQKVRKDAILRSKGPGSENLRLEYLQYVAQLSGGPLGDPFTNMFEESCVEEAPMEVKIPRKDVMGGVTHVVDDQLNSLQQA